MMVLDPNDTTHEIRIIPRFTPAGILTLSITEKFNDEQTDVENTYTYLNGYLTITFDYVFKERDNYRLKIINGGEVIYRGYIFATSQDPQTFKLSNNVYL